MPSRQPTVDHLKFRRSPASASEPSKATAASKAAWRITSENPKGGGVATALGPLPDPSSLRFAESTLPQGEGKSKVGDFGFGERDETLVEMVVVVFGAGL